MGAAQMMLEKPQTVIVRVIHLTIVYSHTITSCDA